MVVPLKYCIVAVVTGFAFVVLGLLFSVVHVAFNKVWVVVVLTEDVVRWVSRKLVALVLSKVVWWSLCDN